MDESYAQQKLDGNVITYKKLKAANVQKKITTYNYKSRKWFKELKQSTKICRYCRCELTKENRTVDHIISRAAGGGNTKDNIQIICDECNTEKRDWTHKRMLARHGRPE